MARVELIMPKLGESVMEATILSWDKNVGDTIELDENVLTIATDKVDTQVPSPVAGTLVEILYPADTTVAIGKPIAIIETAAGAKVEASPAVQSPSVQPQAPQMPAPQAQAQAEEEQSSRFYSPLVKSIAKEEGIGMAELEQVPGTGKDGRVTKEDLLAYLSKRGQVQAPVIEQAPAVQAAKPQAPAQQPAVAVQSFNLPPIDKSNVDIVEMDRMRRMIADHMVMSKHVSAHVTSFVEIDVTNIVKWREKVKDEFQARYGEKITYTPLFIEAVVKALRDFPMVNISVEGTNIIRHRSINLGMATALPSGNLIVPVIKNADLMNLAGLTKSVNDLANRARANKLKPEEIQGGTFTLTNVGIFGSMMGTPIINQPQVAIMATGEIRKKPVVIETEAGDVIAIRQMMFLSMSYDHRVVDGMLGSKFMRRVADYLEQFDVNRGV
jgi:2-oxoglutarate dehydrogenase E2 component (dihydrolipoamide succinyltransferase)